MNDVKPFTNRLLTVLRFLSTTIIAFLLLAPMVKMTIHKKEKPVVVFAQDNSESILYNRDSAFYKNQYAVSVKKLIDELGKDYDIRLYDFGDRLRSPLSFGFSDKQTDISSIFSEMQSVFANRNVGAVILASDGLYNNGKNPLYSAANIQFPVYTIALGDTNRYRDLIVSGLNFNKVTFLGNNFPVELLISAFKAKGQQSVLSVFHNNELLYTKNIIINDDRFYQNINIQLPAKEPGMQRFRVVFSPIQGEENLINNSRDFFVHVLDSRQKILILAEAPHPDLSALKQSIETNDNYKVDVIMADDYNSSFAGYGLVILHQLPSLKHSERFFKDEITRNHVPVLFILGGLTNLNSFNNLNTGLILNTSKTQTDEALPEMNNSFTYFTLSDEIKRAVQEYPPLNTPYGDYKVFTSSSVLLYQRIGSVITQKPLILFNKDAGLVNGIITGEGIWKWRLYNYMKEENHNAFDELINKTVQYLSVKGNTGLFRVFVKNVIPENEETEFEAELYNESYELINEAEVHLTIYNSENKKYEFTFGKTDKAFHLNAVYFPEGEYKYSATVVNAGKTYGQKGAFYVAAVNLEAINTIADHALLNKLAKEHDGTMIFPGEISRLPEILKKRNDIKPLSYTIKNYSELINLPLLLLFIIMLLSAEWFTRKRSGGY